MNKVKTIRELLSELHSPAREEAIENCREYGLLDVEDWCTPAEALQGAFLWSRTKQGLKYWSKVNRKLLQKEKKEDGQN